MVFLSPMMNEGPKPISAGDNNDSQEIVRACEQPAKEAMASSPPVMNEESATDSAIYRQHDRIEISPIDRQ